MWESPAAGAVRAEIGRSYLLKSNEELWEKDLHPVAEALISQNLDPLTDRGAHRVMAGCPCDTHAAPGSAGAAKARAPRDRSKVVTFRVPHNAAVQIYGVGRWGARRLNPTDFKARTARVCFGPGLVMLGPDEQFTLLSLSGGTPKKACRRGH